MRLIPLLFKHRRYIAPLCLLSGVLTLGVVSGGCGGSAGVSICDQLCNCQGCSTDARQSCEKTFDDNEKVSADEGCTQTTDDYYSCRASRGQCIGARWDDSGGCEVERNKYTNCLTSAKCAEVLGVIHCF